MSALSSFKMEHQPKQQRQVKQKRKSDQYQTDRDSVDVKVAYKRKEKYNNWKHQTNSIEDDYDD